MVVGRVRIEDLLQDAGRREFAAVPEADALTDEGALQEAALVGLQVDAVCARAWLLFDCRGASQIEMGNTAVVDWSPVSGPDGWHVEIARVPSSRLSVSGAEAEFFVGDVPGGDEPPPDFLDATDEEIRSGLPGWSSDFEPVHASFSSRAGP